MGLLAALDSHKEAIENAEVEYRLYSWGEIFPPFLGDREHSSVARFILDEFPFKLFSSSTPYDDPLPQKLCLTFKAPVVVKKKDKRVHIRGIFVHEIANEFAAFLSLYTRRRVFAEKQLRSDGLPIEIEGGIYQRSHFQERQRLKEVNPDEIYQLLNNLQSVDRNIAKGFVLAMRLYHSAVEMMYVDPEFAYLLLITALEAISSVTYKNYKPENEEEFLDSRFPGWKENLENEQKNLLKEVLLKGEKYTFQKLLQFVSENLPKQFWSETKDDAKPDNFHIMIKGGIESLKHADTAISQFDKIEKNDLNKTLREIYKTRSKLIHEGMRFPEYIVMGLFLKMSPLVLGEILPLCNQGGLKLEIPPLITFERLVSYSMVEYLRKKN